MNNVTTWRGDVIVGTIPANGARELNQNQIRHKKCGRQKTLGWTSLRRLVTWWKRKGKTEKTQKKIAYRDELTLEWTQ